MSQLNYGGKVLVANISLLRQDGFFMLIIMSIRHDVSDTNLLVCDGRMWRPNEVYSKRKPNRGLIKPLRRLFTISAK